MVDVCVVDSHVIMAARWLPDGTDHVLGKWRLPAGTCVWLHLASRAALLLTTRRQPSCQRHARQACMCPNRLTAPGRVCGLNQGTPLQIELFFSSFFSVRPASFSAVRAAPFALHWRAAFFLNFVIVLECSGRQGGGACPSKRLNLTNPPKPRHRPSCFQLLAASSQAP